MGLLKSHSAKLLLERMRHMPNLFAETPGLHNIMQTDLHMFTCLPVDSPLVLLRRLIERAALPNSLYLMESSRGGETTQKTPLFRDAFSVELAQAEDFESRLWHLMCFAGRDSSGNPVLLNVPKPVFGEETCSPFLLKTEAGHLVLNQEVAAQQVGGFTPLDAKSLGDLSGGMQKHGVNFLLSSQDYDSQVSLRVVFCQSLFDLFWHSSETEIQLIEVPLGHMGDCFSVVIPIELFMAFLTELQHHFPHVELQSHGRLAEGTICTAMGVFKRLLELSSLEQLLQYNDKRPIMAGFNAIVRTLAKELVARAPFIPEQTARVAVTNFVRHFFSVEHSLLAEALEAKDRVRLRDCYGSLAQTEYAKFFVSCSSFEEFEAKIEAEQQKKQPEVPFEFSSEVGKSSLYLSWLERMGAKLGHHVTAIARQKPEGLRSTLDGLSARLSSDCEQWSPGEDAGSMRNAAEDFVGMFFGRHLLLLEKIESKMRILRDPSRANDRATSVFWSNYWKSTERMLRGADLALGDAQKSEIIKRAIIPDLMLLRSLPFARELGVFVDKCWQRSGQS